jgi:hypothetical protein
VLVVVRRFRVPRYIARASREQLRRPCGFLQCCSSRGVDGEGEGSHVPEELVEGMVRFGALTAAPWHHVALDLGVVDEYEFVFKMDADVTWLLEPPLSPGAYMRGAGCVVAHAQVNEIFDHAHCARALVGTVSAFARAHNMTPASVQHGWCASQQNYMYGNFVGLWVPFLRAPARRALSRYVYENHAQFYGVDQWMANAHVCMFYDAPSLNWEPPLAPVCNLMSWRGGWFLHP